MEQKIITNYLVSKVVGEEHPREPKRPTIAITISRDAGCGASELAKLLQQHLDGQVQPGEVKWRILSKELIRQAAQKLHLNPDELEQLIEEKERSFVEEILDSLSSKAYPNEFKIRRTVREVVLNAINRGNVIIVGRGAEAITKGYKNVVHVKLTAPFAWRLKHVASQEGVENIKDLATRMQDTDNLRNDFNKLYLMSGDQDSDDHLYDVIYDVSRLKPKAVARSLLVLLGKDLKLKPNPNRGLGKSRWQLAV